MSDLIKIINQEGNLVVSSREVARDFEKEHHHVVDAIENKINNLTHEKSEVKISDLFIESEFNHRGNNYKEYLLTRDGFSFIVMGFTGAKADTWKLKYIKAFNEMEETIKKNQLMTNSLSPELQVLINLELQQKEMQQAITENRQEIQDMRDVIKLDTTSWRSETTNLVNKMAFYMGGNEHIKVIREESYKLLNERMGVSLGVRLTNKRRRMADEGVSKSKRDKLNYLDIIAEDKKLIEGYTAIIKEMAIKYGVA